MNKVYEIITDKIIKDIETSGTLIWRKDWINKLPKNYISKKHYNGINFFILAIGIV
jgi:antirestriction protein ArdC